GLALDFAIAHPEVVTGLVLIGPVVHGMATTEYFNARGNRNNAPLARGDVRAAAENWSNDRFQIAGNDRGARRALYDETRTGARPVPCTPTPASCARARAMGCPR